MENTVPLGTYNFIFTSIYMKEGEIFIIRNQMDLFSKSINYRIPNRVKLNRKNPHPRASLYLRDLLFSSSRIKRWETWGGRRGRICQDHAGQEPDLLPVSGSKFIQPPWFSRCSSKGQPFLGRPCPLNLFVLPSPDKPSVKKL